MPLPAYIVCCEGVSIDKDTNKVTLFNVSENLGIMLRVQIEQAVQAAQAGGMTPLRILSVWIKESGDLPDAKFENHLVLHFSEQNEMVIANASFSFSGTFHRILTPPIFIPGFPGPGFFRIESRLRRVGETEWICRQFFYVELIAVDIGPVPAQPTPG